ncbi:MAG: ribosome silencing factor [Candidatus Atribacteria bacterium]|nr:ribosome silencing factor [Candidatus Atribacteria bacterium]
MRNNSKDIAIFLASALNDKKAKDTIILNIKKISFIADYFIITTAQSQVHLKTLSRTVIEKIKESGIRRNVNYEGDPSTGWILLDCGDIVIHLFTEEKRDYYHLEYIWHEAEKISMKE